LLFIYRKYTIVHLNLGATKNIYNCEPIYRKLFKGGEDIKKFNIFDER